MGFKISIKKSNRVYINKDELESENRSLKSELEISELLLEKCNDKIYGDAFLLERRGTSGDIRLEGYEEAVEYLQECCW